MLASSSEQQTDNATHHDEDFSYVGKNLNHSTHQHEKKERIIPENKLTGYEFWKSIGSPKHVVAPMVDQSELAFRLLAQNHGSTLAYTPMFHGRIFVQDETYQKTHFQFLESEGPVFAQFCANDPNIFVECGWLAWELSNQKIAAVDLNLGCPQRIAKKGRYGSYLMEDIDLICSMIEKAHKELPVPVTAKIRIFDDAEHTLKYVDRILEAGAQVLCVHGRTRDQRGHNQNYADWKMIKLIREHVPHIPVIANGNIRMYQDIIDCLEYTGADAVMSADPLLCNPALFNGGHHVNAIDLCEEYINICEKYPPPDHSFIKRHLFQMLDHTLGTHNHLRASLAKASGIQKYREFVNHLRENKDSLVVDPPVYEPSIMVVKDPKNHPIDKKPRGRGCKPCDDELVPGINDN